MNIDLAYVVSALIGIVIALIAFPGKDRFYICTLMALTGLLFAGVMDMDKNGSDSHLAKVLDPFAAVLTGIIGYQGHEQTESPCPPESNAGQYGDAARYDGILITGSPEFVSKTVTALERLYSTQSYRFAKALRHIEERDLPRDRWAQVTGRHAVISPRAAARSCTFLAGTIVHEGAHVIYGSGHGPVYAAQARALEEMGEANAAKFTMRLARDSE